MLRITYYLILSLFLISTSSCQKQEWKSIYLPDISNLGYIIKVQNLFYGSGKKEDFNLQIKSKMNEYSGIFLKASQCKNVEIIREINEIYIFYDKIEITYFVSQFSEYNQSPIVNICNINNKYCKYLYDSKIANGPTHDNICVVN